MNNHSELSSHPLGELSQARMLAGHLKDCWNEGERADALKAIHDHPDLIRHKSIVLDLAYEEFCQRTELGESVSIAAFCENYPGCRASLRRLLEMHQWMDLDPELLAPPEPPKWPEPGDNVMGFDVLEEIGRGAFARVYQARDPSLGNRLVALKVTCDGHEEAGILGKLNHPNVVEVYSAPSDEDAGYVVICMPYFGRATLADVIDRVFHSAGPRLSAAVLLDAIEDINREGKGDDDGDGVDGDSGVGGDPVATPDRPVHNGAFVDGTFVDSITLWGAELAEGLAHAHKNGIFHRDIKPSNILVTQSGRPMLLDFNLSQDEYAVTRRIGGTLPYMSPEQIEATLLGGRKTSDVDARSDLFSLGVVLYEALTGKLPFGPPPSSDSPRLIAKQLLARLKAGPLPLGQNAVGVDRSLASLIERCLQFDPDARFQSADELARHLRRQLSIANRVRRALAHHRKATACAATLLLASALAVPYSIAQRPSYAAREYQAGVRLAAAHDYDDAIRRFTQAIQADTDHVEALTARARAYQNLGAFQPAINDYLAACKLRPSAELTAAVGYCFSNLRSHAAAVKFYRDALAQGVNTVAVMNNLGFALEQLKRPQESHRWLTAAIHASSDEQAVFVNRAILDLQHAERDNGYIPEQGMDDIQRALDIGPQRGELLHYAARLSIRIGERDQASREKALEKAFDFLCRAVDHGLDPELLRSNPAFSPLAGDARYQALFQRTRGPVAEYAVERLIRIEP